MSRRVEKRKATLFEKTKKALHLLLVQRRSFPGATGYELKKMIGRKYLYIIKLLNAELESYGLKVKIVLPEDVKDPNNPSLEEYDRSHFYIVANEPIISSGIKGPLNIEELGCLSACIITILARGGKANLKEIEDMLESKLSKIKAKRCLDRLKRLGYLDVDSEDNVSLGWRAKAEINLDNLTKILAIYRS